MASMNKERMYAAGAILSGAIFAIGGQDTEATLDSVECYVPGMNKWVPICPMNIKRSSLQAGVANHILYVYGGFSHERSLDTLEKYSPEDDKWTLVIVSTFSGMYVIEFNLKLLNFLFPVFTVNLPNANSP